MAIEITVPRLGWSMEEGLFAGWLKTDGAAVASGDPLFLLESDKVTMEVESLDTGILHIPADAPRPGSTVTVGQCLAYLLQNGEPAPGATDDDTIIALGQQLGAAAPSHTGTSSPAPAGTAQNRAMPASPRARAAAKALGINIANVRPRPGANRIIEADVLNAKPEPQSRLTVATRMEESFRAPHFYLHADANVEALAAIRHQHRPAAYNDFLLKAIAIALTRHPRINAYWDNGAVVPRATQHVALATQLGDTLTTPVIRDPAEKTVTQIAAGRATATNTGDASATLTNLGAFGVDRFEAILNPPQSIIVAVGRIAKRPVVEGDAVVARLTMPISLSVDHRVADGVPAAQFLQTLIAILESPAATYNEWE